MKLIIILCICIFAFACSSTTKDIEFTIKDLDPEIKIQDTTILEYAELIPDSVSIYLENPVDFYALKKNTLSMHSGGNIRLNNKYFHSIDDDNYIYYDYWAIEFHNVFENDSKPLCFKALKPWGTPEERYYDKDNEILVGIKSRLDWDGLQQSNFVSLSDSVIIGKFGTPDTLLNNCMVYQREDKLLTLKIENSQIAWFKYFWLNDSVNYKEEILREWIQW